MQFLPLPAYRPASPLDFSGLAGAFDSARRNRLAEAGLQLQQDQFGLQRRQADEAFARQKARDAAWDAIKNDPNALAALPNGAAPFVLAAGAEKGPDIAATALLKKRDAEDQNRLYQAQADYYKARAWQARNAHLFQPPGMAPQEPTLPQGWDFNENGQFTRTGWGGAGAQPRLRPHIGGGGPQITQQQVLGSDETRPDTTVSEGDWGASGQTAGTVPGIVVTGRGATDPAATRAYAGQRAADALPDDQRARGRAFKEIQDYWTYHNAGQRPGVGKAYSADGRIVSLERKESVQDTASIASAEMGLGMLDQAEKILTGGRPKRPDGTPDMSKAPVGPTAGNWLGQYTAAPGVLMGGAPGGMGDTGRAFRAARIASMNLAFSLSGKSVSNKEHELFADVFTPSPFDSVETQQWKIEAMRDYFRRSMVARKRGASDEELAKVFRTTLAAGQVGPSGSQPPAGPAAPPQRPDQPRPAAPGRGDLFDKYGLER